MNAPVVVVLRSGRTPFELTLTIGLLALAVWSLLIGAPSTSLDHALEHWQRLLWSSLGLIGSATSLAGIYWRPMSKGLRVEQAGMLMMAGGSLAYVTVICFVSTFAKSGFVVTIGLCIVAGAALRAWEIFKDLSDLRAANQYLAVPDGS